MSRIWARMRRLDARNAAEQGHERPRVAAPQDRHHGVPLPARPAPGWPARSPAPSPCPGARPGGRGWTVSTRLSSSTPRSAHGVRSPFDGRGKPRSAEYSVKMLSRLGGSRRTSGATEKLSPTGWPGVGYGSWPTMSTRTSSNGCLNARSTFSPGRQVPCARPRPPPAGTRPSRRSGPRRAPAPRPSQASMMLRNGSAMDSTVSAVPTKRYRTGRVSRSAVPGAPPGTPDGDCRPSFPPGPRGSASKCVWFTHLPEKLSLNRCHVPGKWG